MANAISELRLIQFDAWLRDRGRCERRASFKKGLEAGIAGLQCASAGSRMPLYRTGRAD
jgi:hypothetical protein